MAKSTVTFQKQDESMYRVLCDGKQIGTIDRSYWEKWVRYPFTIEIRGKRVCTETADCFTIAEAKKAAKMYIESEIT